MISGFEQTHPLEPAQKNRIQWGAAVGAGLLTGIIFLLVPRGTPWSALTFFSPVVLGRNVGSLGVAPAAAWGIHMVLSVIYGLRSEEHTSELQSRLHLVCRLLLEKKKKSSRHILSGR